MASLYKGAKTKVKVGIHLSEEINVDVVVHQGSALSPLLIAIVIDFVTNEIKEGMLPEILYADDLVLMADTMVELQKKLYILKSVCESNGLEVNLLKIKGMVSKI